MDKITPSPYQRFVYENLTGQQFCEIVPKLLKKLKCVDYSNIFTNDCSLPNVRFYNNIKSNYGFDEKFKGAEIEYKLESGHIFKIHEFTMDIGVVGDYVIFAFSVRFDTDYCGEYSKFRDYSNLYYYQQRIEDGRYCWGDDTDEPLEVFSIQVLDPTDHSRYLTVELEGLLHTIYG